MKTLHVLALAALVAAASAPATLRAAGPHGASTVEVDAAAAVREAVLERLGREAEVDVLSVDGAAPGAVFVEAKPSPTARLGDPFRVTLIASEGRPVRATADVRVVVDHVVATHRLERGATLTEDDVEAQKGELVGVPLRALPRIDEVIGARVLRPIDAGAVVLPVSVALRRAVEPGDQVTVVAVRGPIEVTATFIASDGGRPGDVVRVMNPESKRYIRGRVIEEGRVEVLDEN